MTPTTGEKRNPKWFWVPTIFTSELNSSNVMERRPRNNRQTAEHVCSLAYVWHLRIHKNGNRKIHTPHGATIIFILNYSMLFLSGVQLFLWLTDNKFYIQFVQKTYYFSTASPILHKNYIECYSTTVKIY